MHRTFQPGLAVAIATLAPAALVLGCEGNEPSNLPPTAAFTVACEPLECTFTNGSADADGIIERYAWDFGDDSEPATTRDAGHRYAAPGGRFTVTLRVTDDDGATATHALPVDVENANAAPTASFVAVCQGLVCDFADRSADIGGSVTSYAWDFGDGGTASEPNPRHVYAQRGVYSVVLDVTDDGGASATYRAVVEVAPSVLEPTAAFEFVCTGLACEFVNLSVEGESGAPLASFAWEFGDGATSTQEQTSHVFAQEGAYTVALVVTDALGRTGRAERVVTLPAIPSGLTAAFGVGCDLLVCRFNDQSSGDVIVGWNWNFGDGTTSTEQHPEHTYEVTEPTSFTVTLTVTGRFDLATAVTFRQITVSPTAAGGVWTSRAAMPEPRWRVSAAALGGTIYLVGGVRAGDGQAPRADILAYDPGADSWRTAAALLHPVSGAGVAALGGRLYIVGGSQEKAIQIFDPATGQVEAGPALPWAMATTSAMAIDGKLHVVGLAGLDPNELFCDFCVADYQVLDPSSGTWSRLPSPPAATPFTTAAEVDGKIYLMQWIGDGRLHVYDLALGGWRTSFGAPQGRWGSRALAMGGFLYLVGGSEMVDGNWRISTRVDRYDPATSGWQQVAPLPSGRMDHAAAVLGQALHVIGGSPSAPQVDYSDAHARFTPE